MKRKAFLSALIASSAIPFIGKGKDLPKPMPPEHKPFDGTFIIRGEDLRAVLKRENRTNHPS